MEDKQLNSKESIALIERMLNHTKHNLDKDSGNSFIIWGVSTFAINALVTGLVIMTGSAWAFWLWMLLPVISVTWSRISSSRDGIVKTQVDKMVAQVWQIVISVSVAVPLLVLLFNLKDIPTPLKSVTLFAIVPFVEILVCSVGIAITGAIIGFKPAKIGGLVGIILSFGALMWLDYAVPATFALWSVVSMIIPGVKLRNYVKRCSKN